MKRTAVGAEVDVDDEPQTPVGLHVTDWCAPGRPLTQHHLCPGYIPPVRAGSTGIQCYCPVCNHPPGVRRH